MSPLATAIVWILIPAGLLPILTAWILRRYRDSSSQSLRDRWHLALVLAVLGTVSTVLAGNRAWGWGLQGEWITISFGLVLLAVDVVSGKWLLVYLTGSFSERAGGGPETPIEERRSGTERP